MTRIVIRGYAAVSRDGGEAVTDPDLLRTLAGPVYADELFTEYLDPPNIRGVSLEEKVLARTLEPGGIISFGYHEGDPLVIATTEYTSPRPLTPAELRALVAYTMGQWSDGIGEGLNQYSIHDEYEFLCLWSKEVVEEYWPTADLRKGYPAVEVAGPPEAVQAWLQMVAGEDRES